MKYEKRFKYEDALRKIFDEAFEGFMQRTGHTDHHRAWDEWEECLNLRGFKLVKATGITYLPRDDDKFTWTRYYVFTGDEWLWIGIPTEYAMRVLAMGYMPNEG